MSRLALTSPRLLSTLFLLFVYGAPVSAQEFEWAPDFPVGATIPVLEAPDQNGNQQTLDTLTDEKGLMLVFNRSFDWCPYCKAQLVGLTGASADFRAAGFNIATITYDPVATLKDVEEDMEVNFPMLHDQDTKHVSAFNILNMDYEPGHYAYGIPLPGIMLISSEGVILEKFSEENYRVRPDWSDVVEVARRL